MLSKRRSFLGVVAVGLVLTSCAIDDPDGTPASSAGTSTVTMTPLPSSVQSTPPSPSAPIPTETVVDEPAAEPVPYIVGCQVGLGPIETYWSDGSVTGYSDYCQGQHDGALQREREANTPVCDGTVCRYPSGVEVPDPNAVPDDRCTNQIDYAGDPRSNAEINSIGELTGQCPTPIS